MGFTKLADSIFGSSIMEEPETVRLVWLFFIAAADKSGVVDKTRPALARQFNMPLGEIESAIEILETPDPHSRSSAEDGRRLVRLDEHRDWGWRLVNHGLYRATVDEDGRREYQRKWVANERATKAGKIPPYPEISNGRQSRQVSTESTAVDGRQRRPMQKQKQKQKQEEQSAPGGAESEVMPDVPTPRTPDGMHVPDLLQGKRRDVTTDPAQPGGGVGDGEPGNGKPTEHAQQMKLQAVVDWFEENAPGDLPRYMRNCRGGKVGDPKWNTLGQWLKLAGDLDRLIRGLDFALGADKLSGSYLTTCLSSSTWPPRSRTGGNGALSFRERDLEIAKAITDAPASAGPDDAIDFNERLRNLAYNVPDARDDILALVNGQIDAAKAEKIDEQLGVIERALLAEFRSKLDAEAREEVLASIEESMAAGVNARLTEAEKKERRREIGAQVLRERSGVPVLGLFVPEALETDYREERNST